MLIHRKGKAILDVVAAAKGKDRPNQLVRGLAEAAMGPLNYTSTLFRYASFDLDRSNTGSCHQASVLTRSIFHLIVRLFFLCRPDDGSL